MPHGKEKDGTLQTKLTLQNNLAAAQSRHAHMQFVFGSLGVLLMVLQNELAWHSNGGGWFPLCGSDQSCHPRDISKSVFPLRSGMPAVNTLRILISLTTAIMLHFQTQYYGCAVERAKLKNLLPPTATLRNSPLFKTFVVEACVLVVHVFPGLETLDGSPTLLLWLSLFMFVRVALLGRVIRFRSALNSPNGRFIQALTSVEFDSSFILKTELKNNPGQCMAVCLLLLLLVTGYSLHLIESIMCGYNSLLDCKPLGFWDAEWLLVITILTVGYGDVYPHTHGGRFVAIVGGLMGTIITAVTIALTTNYLDLTRSQSKVVAFLKRDANKNLVQHQAARTIAAAWNAYGARRHQHAAERALEVKLFGELRKFRAVKRFVQANDGTDPVDRQLTLLEAMEVNVDEISSRMEALHSHVFPEEVESSGVEVASNERACEREPRPRWFAAHPHPYPHRHPSHRLLCPCPLYRRRRRRRRRRRCCCMLVQNPNGCKCSSRRCSSLARKPRPCKRISIPSGYP